MFVSGLECQLSFFQNSQQSRHNRSLTTSTKELLVIAIQHSIMATPVESKDDPPAATSAPPAPSAEAAVEGDSDPDFDDLDDVLDQFSANALANPASAPQPQPQPETQKEPAPSSSGPGRPTEDIPIPSGPGENESEDEFMARLTKEMSSVMSKLGDGMPTDTPASSEDLAKMGKELENFTYKMEKEGIKPEDLLKAILGEEQGTKLAEGAHEERERRESESQSQSRPPAPSKSTKAKSPSPSQPANTAAASSFEDTIRRTMERIDESSQKATSATQKSSSSEDEMLANLLKALQDPSAAGTSGDPSSDPDSMSKMLLDMMSQLTNKEMLYEPMAELNQKFPAYLAKNKSKLKTEDYARYARQKEIVKDIVNKFEEKGYSDEDPKCREYVWEKMQLMQEQGAPPEELISNPVPGLGMPGLGGGEGMEEGCPTQ